MTDPLKEAVTTTAAASDPDMALELAEENARLRSSVKGSFAVIYALVKRAGGRVVISRYEYVALPKNTDLTVVEGDDEVTITIIQKPRES